MGGQTERRGLFRNRRMLSRTTVLAGEGPESGFRGQRAWDNATRHLLPVHRWNSWGLVLGHDDEIVGGEDGAAVLEAGPVLTPATMRRPIRLASELSWNTAACGGSRRNFRFIDARHSLS
jgi:hypothetical protein